MILNSNFMALILSLGCKIHLCEMKCRVIFENERIWGSVSKYHYLVQSKWTGEIKYHSSRTFI